MRRQLALIEHALGGLRRRRGKSLAIGLGLAFVVGLVAATLLLTQALQREYAGAAERMPDLTVQRLVAGRPALIGESTVDAIEALPAVRSVRPRVWGYYFFTAVEANVTVVGVEPADEPRAVHTGRLPRDGAEIAIGEGLAELLGLRIGDEIGVPIGGEVVFSEVVGTFGDASAIRTADLIIATPAHARRLLGVPDLMATDLAVELSTMDEAAVVSGHISGLVEGARVLDRRLLRRTYELTFDTRGGLLSVMLLPALAAFLLLAWERLSGLGPSERREIGVLKAIGWSTSDVLAARMWESVVIGAGGAAFGLVLGYVYVFWLGAPGLMDALLGWSAIHPPLDLAPTLALADLVALLGAVVVPFVAISVVPAWRASMLDPDQAMRGAA